MDLDDTLIALADETRRDILKRLAAGVYPIFQLDATAYPGNSGSPLYDPESGEVIAVINMVFVKQEDWSFGRGEPWN